jgi:hypothetical protein
VTSPIITDPALNTAYAELEKAYDAFLAKHGVSLPGPETQQALVLVYLFQRRGQLVSLEDLRAFVRSHYPEGSQDIQPRHLKYDGWHILLSGKSGDILPNDAEYTTKRGEKSLRKAHEKLPNGHIMLLSESSPSPDFELRKRRGTLDRNSWESLLQSYDSTCAVCGAKKANLEKGHKDPTKGYELDNIIPMCSECNNWASSDLVFDDRGRIVAVASPRFVKSATLDVKLKVFHELRKDKTVNPKGK